MALHVTAQHDTEYDSDDDVRKSFEAAYEAIRERIRNGGPGWVPKVNFSMDGCYTSVAKVDAATGGPDQAAARS